MSFGSPELLLGLLFLPAAVLAYFLADEQRREWGSAWSSRALLPNMARDAGRRRLLPPLLYLLAATLLLVGFARPRAHFSEVKPGATIVVALDESGSMDAPDVHPTRLRAADAILTRFVDELPSGYQVALITFADDFAVTVPPTYDRTRFVAALPRHAELQGSAVGDGVAAAVKAALHAVGPLRKGELPPATILLVSDGAQNAGRTTPAQAAALARKDGIPVSTLLLGTPSGVVVQHLQVAGSTRTVTESLQVPVEPQTLQAIAAASGGTSYRAASSADLERVASGLGQRLLHDSVLRELTVFFVAAALVLALAAAVLSGLWFRRLV